MLSFFKQFAGRRTHAALESRVREIAAHEPDVARLGNDALLAESQALRTRIQGGEQTLDEALPRAFALVREAAKRTLGQRPFDVQLMGGIVLHEGSVAEMGTGEGKTLAGVAPAYLNALAGRGMHVVTVNEYLARRDAVWMGQIYRALGLSVACLVPNGAYLYDPEWKIPPEGSALADQARDTTGSFVVQQEYLKPISRREAYLADITYGTNHEFGFDYLRDNLAYSLESQVQREHAFAIIDEVDSILIDEARTPLIISAPDAQSSEFYKTFARIAERLVREDDYIVDEKLRSVAITEQGIDKVEKMIGVQDLYGPQNLRLVHYLEESLKAVALFRRDKEYVVKDGEIVIVDEFTGRMLHGRRYNGGLHQAIEAKEGVTVQEESRTYAKISIQNYFRMYEKIAGMTGTAQTSAEEFHKVYGLDVVSIPPNKPSRRTDMSDAIYRDTAAKYKAVAREVKRLWELGRPVLLGTASIEKNELLSSYLSKEGVPHEVLNAKNNEREGAIIAQAGRLKAVTVATNMAGRGVDIILGGNPPDADEAEKVRELGGLCVIGTERHEARRIDNQLRGRAGRQGDPGSSQFFLSLEDDLLRIFGGDRIKNLMHTFNLPEDQPIDMALVSRAVSQAQARVEGANFDMRKHLLEYDDVLNKQRSSVYDRRKKLLTSMTTSELGNIVFESAKEHLDMLWEHAMSGSVSDDADTKTPDEIVRSAFLEAGIVKDGAQYPADATLPALENVITKKSFEAVLDPLTLSRMLSILDMLWMSHLDDLEALSESVRLRAYGQKDPLVEYRREASNLFKNFWTNFNAWVFNNIFKLSNPQAPSAQDVLQGVPSAIATPGGSVVSADGVGRNDPCPCGSGKKYKKCHGK